MLQDHDSATLTPKDIIENFKQVYRMVYHNEAHVVHMFAEWYQVNGETVHRLTLFQETVRLNGLIKQQQQRKPPAADRSVIHRLIAKLRGV